MKRIFIVVFGLLTCVTFSARSVDSVTRRALLVGINEYEIDNPTSPERNWTNLQGAINDVDAISSILMARFGFGENHIRILKNGAATREMILRSLHDHLIEPTQPGDVCVFFYAGHGSQVVNSKTDEADLKDETIVPADANRGQPDIRDKELGQIFNDILDKGALLTVILDACHSTSLQRGLPTPTRSRMLQADTRDIAEDLSDPRGRPETRGALVLSASQEFESAREVEVGGVIHGGFSYALANRLRSVSTQQRAELVFLSVTGHMKSMGLPQEPNLAGSAERRASPLFGGRPANDRIGTAVALLSVDKEGRCVLEGGYAIGLNPGCELRWLGRGESATQRDTLRIRVQSVESLVRSSAVVVLGDYSRLEPGDLFLVERWAAPIPHLRVFVPEGTPSYDELKWVAESLWNRPSVAGIKWIVDPTEETPTHVLRWSKSSWRLVTSAHEADLGQSPSWDSILQKLREWDEERSAGTSRPSEIRLFLQLPPPIELTQTLRLGEGNSSIDVTHKVADAHYLLVGRFEANKLQYAWVLPNMTGAEAAIASSLPVRTRWCAESGRDEGFTATSQELRQQAWRLGVIRSWLALEAPPDDGYFPYRLAIRNTRTGLFENSSTVTEGESLQVVLRAHEKDLALGIESRFVYIFALDAEGNTTLLIPRGCSNVENYISQRTLGSLPAEIPLAGGSVVVSGPFGIDTFVMLSTRDPIPEPCTLEGSGVRSDAPISQDPLKRLLEQVGSGTRGVTTVTTSNWSIERLSILSKALSGNE